MTEPALTVPPALLDAIADRVADRLAERLPNRPEPYLDSRAAAQYLDAPRSRIHDLVDRGVLVPHRDGRRLLFRASELDAALSRNGQQLAPERTSTKDGARAEAAPGRAARRREREGFGRSSRSGV